MFTGIIETTGTVSHLQREAGNLHITVASPISAQLKIDQSISHNGVCLTVVGVNENSHRVTAIDETLQKTNLSLLQVGDVINLERCTQVGSRLDGHIVQGHVDQTGECVELKEENGSWLFTFRYTPNAENLIVEKGSICVNGISLTAFNEQGNRFTVAIIPYTWEHTNLKWVKPGTIVNLEFDIIGKYVARLLAFQATQQPSASGR